MPVIICAWCKNPIRDDPDEEKANSHGICKKCLEIQNKKIEERIKEWKKKEQDTK